MAVSLCDAGFVRVERVTHRMDDKRRVEEIRIVFTSAAIESEHVETLFQALQSVWDSCGEKSRLFFTTFDLTGASPPLDTHLLRRAVSFFWKVKSITREVCVCTLVRSDSNVAQKLVTAVTAVYPPTKPVRIVDSQTVTFDVARTFL